MVRKRRRKRKNTADIFVDVPEGKSGDWSIVRFTVSNGEASIFNLGEDIYGDYKRYIKPGVYTRLMYKDTIVMSDTPAEKMDHREFISKAKGRVLMNGLGLGYAVKACCQKKTVQHITVIEKSADVIKLCGTHYLTRYSDKVDIIHADAFTWDPPKDVRYDVVWHDIWYKINSENLKEMDQLRQKYEGISDWQDSWCRDECERRRAIESSCRDIVFKFKVK